MSRLQTKCVFASATAHLLLLAVLVVSSAFVKPPPPPENVRMIHIFNASKITDDETQGGGNPNVPSDVQPAPPPPAPVIPQPTPSLAQEPPIKVPEPEKKQEPPKHEKKKKQPEPPPEPIKKETKKPETKTESHKILKKQDSPRIVPKSQLTEKPPEPKPDKPKIEVDLTAVKHTKDDPEFQKRQQDRIRAEKEERKRREEERQMQVRAEIEMREAAQREYRERQQALGTIVGNIENKMSSGTVVEMPGPGGEAFINYADLIWTKYYQAWQRPEDHEVRSPVRVEIVVNRDGRIVSANIVKSSGDAALDRSVRQTLDRVHSLPAFPEGAKDPQRTFTINFYLKSKRSLG